MAPDDAAVVEPTAPARPGQHSRRMLTAVVGNGYPAAIAFFTGPILAHSLGVDGRGAVAAATAPLALVTTVVTFGIPEAVTYTVARHRDLVRRAAGRGSLILLLAGLLATLAVALAAPVLSGGDHEVRRLLLISCLAIAPSLLVGLLRGVASAQHLWWRVTAERILSSTLRLVVLIPFWLTGTLTPLIATIAIAAMPVAGGCVYLGLFRGTPVAGAKPDGDAGGPGDARVRSLLGYGVRIWVGSLSGILLSRLDQTLLTPLASPYQLGLYVVAVSVSELPLIINSAVRDVTFVTDAHESVDARLAASARISTAACAVVGLALGVSMVWWLPLLFGPDFGPALPVAWVLLAAVVLGTPGSIAGSGLSARGRPGLRSTSLVVACLCNIVLLVVLAGPLGALGAAIATFVGNLLASNLNLLFLSRVFAVPARQFYGLRRSDIAILRRAAGGLRSRARGGSR